MDFCGFFGVSGNNNENEKGASVMARPFAGVAFTLFLLIVCSVPLWAQSPGYTDFSSPANLTLQGDAFFPESSPNVLRLTPAVTQRVGGAWFNFKQPVAGGFTSVFTFQITNSSGNPNFPADGIAFVIQNAPPSELPPFSGTAALAGAGGSLGYAAGLAFRPPKTNSLLAYPTVWRWSSTLSQIRGTRTPTTLRCRVAVPPRTTRFTASVNSLTLASSL